MHKNNLSKIIIATTLLFSSARIFCPGPNDFWGGEDVDTYGRQPMIWGAQNKPTQQMERLQALTKAEMFRESAEKNWNQALNEIKRNKKLDPATYQAFKDKGDDWRRTIGLTDEEELELYSMFFQDKKYTTVSCRAAENTEQQDQATTTPQENDEQTNPTTIPADTEQVNTEAINQIKSLRNKKGLLKSWESIVNNQKEFFEREGSRSGKVMNGMIMALTDGQTSSVEGAIAYRLFHPLKKVVDETGKIWWETLFRYIGKKITSTQEALGFGNPIKLELITFLQNQATTVNKRIEELSKHANESISNAKVMNLRQAKEDQVDPQEEQGGNDIELDLLIDPVKAALGEISRCEKRLKKKLDSKNNMSLEESTLRMIKRGYLRIQHTLKSSKSIAKMLSDDSIKYVKGNCNSINDHCKDLTEVIKNDPKARKGKSGFGGGYGGMEGLYGDRL